LEIPVLAKIGNKQIDAMILPHAGTAYVHEIVDTILK